MLALNNPTAAMRFTKTWRPYQERVLAAVKEHLSDRRLHVVAAPGAGKTTLGLEIFRLLGQPAIVLAPSRTIRDQWITRLRDFLPEGDGFREWTGTRLEERTFFTAITYQALHTKYRRDAITDEDEDPTSEADEAPEDSELQVVVDRCRELGVRTVILDEAHHLRQEWWRALSKFAAALDQPILVCLTATPPYDVVGSEWRRYQELCGPVDEEISVPELVRAGTLCPHQDYVWVCRPAETDVVTSRQHDQNVVDFLVSLTADVTLREAIVAHPWVASPHVQPETVLDDPEFAVSVLSFLQSWGLRSPARLLELIDCDSSEVPKMDRRWWQVLLKRYLFVNEWPEAYQEHRDSLARRMRKLGLLHRRELRLSKNAAIQGRLAQSSAKIEACLAIHRQERSIRASQLRQVILTDYIREDECDRLGAWPVFHALVRASPERSAGVALVTGRLAIMHESLSPELQRQVTGISIAADPNHAGFVRVSQGGRAVDFLTQCLNRGRIDTLVGTRSLLGEGWDCPAVNSLVLASFVGAFVTTNQMRGRALRIDHTAPDKVASIWHLIAVDPTTPTGMADLEQLTNRFDSFAGLHATTPSIESGLARLDMGDLSRREDLAAWNAESIRRLRGLARLKERWQTAVETGDHHRLLAGVDSAPVPQLRSFAFENTLKYLLYTAATTFAAYFASGMKGLRPGQLVDRPRFFLAVALVSAVALAFSLPKLLKAASIAFRHFPVDGSLKQIALALLDTLAEEGMLTSPRNRLDVRCRETAPGQFSLILTGGSFYEASLFADSLASLLGPIENPRYLVTRRSLVPWLPRRVDYHAVPPILSGKKEHAEAFLRHWQRHVTPADLIFTRTPDGRKTLLRARTRALSAAFTEPVHRRDRWC
jgi:superfamily II DNA or RNA helicase